MSFPGIQSSGLMNILWPKDSRQRRRQPCTYCLQEELNSKYAANDPFRRLNFVLCVLFVLLFNRNVCRLHSIHLSRPFPSCGRPVDKGVPRPKEATIQIHKTSSVPVIVLWPLNISTRTVFAKSYITSDSILRTDFTGAVLQRGADELWTDIVLIQKVEGAGLHFADRLSRSDLLQI